MDKNTIRKHTISDILNILGDSPQSDGLHVHLSKNEFTKIPFPYPFRSDDYVILLVMSGKLKIQLNLITHNLEVYNVVIIKPKTVVHILEMSSDIEVNAISFTTDFALQNRMKKNEFDNFGFFVSKTIPNLMLEKEEAENFNLLTNLLEQKNSNNNNSYFAKEIIALTFNLVVYELANLYKKYTKYLKIDISRKEELSLKFLKLTEENCKCERSVRFYADKLFITTGYLSKVLKEVSGKTAGQLIDDAVIMEARILLTNPSLTIAQISDELQFSDQSFFGKYFKKKIGLSPSEYRKEKK